MGFLDKLVGAIGGAAGGSAGGKFDGKREEIRNIFNAKVSNGESYTVLAGMNLVTTKKLTKEVRTYYNYLIGYQDGDDPEIVLITATNDLTSVDEPVICKKSECTKAVYLQNTGSFSVSHPKLDGGAVDFSIISSAAGGAPGTGALIIPVSYLEEYTPFTEFFQTRFAK